MNTCIQNTKKENGFAVTMWGLCVNVVLVGLKLFFGITGKSYALVADAVHSCADFISDIITLVGEYFGHLPPDDCHPYGHQKIETIAEIAMGAVLIAVASGMAWSAGRAIYRHDTTVISQSLLVVAFVSVIVKEILYHITIRRGREINSALVVANAWHHRSDALSSAIVLVGLSVAFFFPQWRIIDAYLGFLVAFVVVRIGGTLFWDALRRIVDTRPPDEFAHRIEEVLQKARRVRNYHNLKMRYVGRQIFIELHIEVDPDMSIYEGHEVAQVIKHEIMQKESDVYDVLIHIEPEGDHKKNSE